MECPLYDNSRKEKAHGLACTSPVCPPSSDCGGSITNIECKVPAFIWRKLAVPILLNKKQSI